MADRRSFPLVLEFVPRPAASRTVVIGNAAQTLHPVAGQGFNVGLRDAYELSRVIVATPRDALGERAMLDRYASRRRSDRLAGIAFTHGLVTLFGADHALLRWPRGVGLSLLDALASGEAGVHPDDVVRPALNAERCRGRRPPGNLRPMVDLC